MGEGWGEGGDTGSIRATYKALAPSPQPSPARGEGAKNCLASTDPRIQDRKPDQ